MIKKIFPIFLSLCLLINAPAYSAIEGGGSGNGYVPYTGATEDVDLGSQKLTAGVITDGTIDITGGNIADIGILYGDSNCIRIGDYAASPMYIASPTEDDLFVTGYLECYRLAYFANGFDVKGGWAYFNSSSKHQDGVAAYFGSSSDSCVRWNTSGNHYLFIGTECNSSSYSGNIIIADKGGGWFKDWGHPVSINPRLYIQSNDEDSTNDYISFWHDQTDGNIAVGAGNLNMTAASGILVFGGTGGTNNESLTLDFETYADKVTFGTTTGITDLDFSSFNVDAGVYKIGGEPVIKLADTQNTYVGVNAGGGTSGNNYDTLVGYEAGYTIDSSTGRGEKNVFVGAQAGYGGTSETDNTGEENVGVGYRAMYFCTNGWGNTAVGFEAMHRITTGYYNVAIGRQALWTNMTGDSNVAIGYNCMDDHSPDGVVAIGKDCLGNATGIDSSVVIGYRAAYTNSVSGDNQTIVGYEAGNKLTSGANNTYYGWRAGYNNMTGSGNVCLGYLAGYSETGSNKLYIDNSSTSTPLIYGDFSTDELTINGLLRITNILELSGLTSDPSTPADGSIWHRSDLGEIRVRLGGTTYKLTMSPA